MRPKSGITIVEVLIILVVIGVLAALLLPPGHNHCKAREGALEHLIDNLTQAVKCYEFENGEFPPGDGTGSASLVTALSQPGPRGSPHMELRPSMLLNGHVRNPVWDGEILYYRRNYPGSGIHAHNRTSFDIRARGCDAESPGENLPVPSEEPDLVTNRKGE